MITVELPALLERIEKLRKQLNDLGPSRDLTDPEIIRISRLLDLALNEYQKLLTGKTKGRS